MNTANLQLEGMLILMNELIALILRKDIATRSEIEDLLKRAEETARSEQARRNGLSEANIAAISFPARHLQQALLGHCSSFSEITASAGRVKRPV